MFSKEPRLIDTHIEGRTEEERSPSRSSEQPSNALSSRSLFSYGLKNSGSTVVDLTPRKGKFEAILLDAYDEVEIHVSLEAGSMLIVDIDAVGIESGSQLTYDESEISDNPPDGVANYIPADQVYRLITSRAMSSEAARTIALRLGNVDHYSSTPQGQWKIKGIKVWGVLAI